MSDIYCLGCGCVFDARSFSCPRCRRCPNCGTVQPEQASRCAACGYPADLSSIEKHELRYNPILPANQREIRALERANQIEEIQSQISIWKTMLLSLLLTPLWLLTAAVFLTACGLNVKWAPAIGLMLTLASFRMLLHQMVQGKFRWFLRK